MKYRVLRGGSFFNDSWGLRIANWDAPERRCAISGFRIVVVRGKP